MAERHTAQGRVPMRICFRSSLVAVFLCVAIFAVGHPHDAHHLPTNSTQALKVSQDISQFLFGDSPFWGGSSDSPPEQPDHHFLPSFALLHKGKHQQWSHPTHTSRSIALIVCKLNALCDYFRQSFLGLFAVAIGLASSIWCWQYRSGKHNHAARAFSIRALFVLLNILLSETLHAMCTRCSNLRAGLLRSATWLGSRVMPPITFTTASCFKPSRHGSILQLIGNILQKSRRW